jgi:hypothetical protein
MTDTPTLRRLIDLPGIDALELKALMKPRAADPDALYDFPEIAEAIDETARAAFGLTPDEAAAVARPEGWDVLDTRRKPLRMLAHWALPLALAMRGIAGELPFRAEPDQPVTDWGSNLKAEATRFRKR